MKDTIQKAEKVASLLREYESTKYRLEEIGKHSFGWGTSCYDIDEYLRPVAKSFLEAKLARLERDISSSVA